MTVFVVVKQVDAGIVAGVFSSLHNAAVFVEHNPYAGFVISEHTVDGKVTVTKSEHVSNAKA